LCAAKLLEKRLQTIERIDVRKFFMLQAADFYGIACCYAQFKVPLSWELSVAFYPEFVEESFTSTSGTLVEL
jgi:hypothetical protein